MQQAILKKKSHKNNKQNLIHPPIAEISNFVGASQNDSSVKVGMPKSSKATHNVVIKIPGATAQAPQEKPEISWKKLDDSNYDPVTSHKVEMNQGMEAKIQAVKKTHVKPAPKEEKQPPKIDD